MAKLCWKIATIVVVVTMGSILSESNGQSTDCINRLMPCLNYLNGAKDVPDSCCDPLKSVIESDPRCMCSMISNRGSRQAEQAGINVSDAQMLPARCGIQVNPLSCITSNGNTGSPNNKNSVDNSSAHVLFSYWAFIVATAIPFVLILVS